VETAARRPVRNSSGHGQNQAKQLLRAPGAQDDDDVDNDDYDDDDDDGEDLAGLNTHTLAHRHRHVWMRRRQLVGR